METKIIETVGLAAGVGGVALGVLFLVFRETLRTVLLPKLSRPDAYRMIRLIIGATWSVAVVGLLSWAWVESGGPPIAPEKSVDTAPPALNGNSASAGTGIANTGEQVFQGPVTIDGASALEKP